MAKKKLPSARIEPTDDRGYPPYSGELATPIEPLEAPPRGLTEEEKDVFSELAHADQFSSISRKLFLLLDYYGIDSDDPLRKDKLIFALMRHHVPGMGVGAPTGGAPTGKGRPKKWTDEQGRALFVCVKYLIASGMSKADALRFLCEEGFFGGSSAEALRKKLEATANDAALIETQDIIDKNFPSPADKATAWGKLVDLFLSEAGIKSP